ncbi:MAG: translation elongation factor EF-1 subunit alpha [Candidatus Heimdallarchaeota archaeon]
MSSEKPHMNLVIIGHVDHGKSTMMGHVLYVAGALDERKLKQFEQEAEQIGKGTFKFAWALDRLKEERERGLTIDVSFYKFMTEKYYYTIIDAPGHRDFIKNMITGTSQADATILVVSARKGEFEAGIGRGGQTVEHAVLAATLGVSQFIVCINKMDDAPTPWEQARFDEVKSNVENVLQMIQRELNVELNYFFVPTSGWTGDNLREKSPNMPWYDGPTVLEALDQVVQPEKPLDKPLRLPIQDVYSITGVGTVPVGRIETGVLKADDKIVIMPEGHSAEVKSIEMHHETIPKAEPGDNVGFNIKGLSRGDLRRGDVASHPKTPPTVAKSFTAQIFVLFHPTAISQGYTPVIHAHTAQQAGTFIQLKEKIDRRTGEKVEDNPTYLKTGDSAVVEIQPLRPMCVERFTEFPQLGRFAIRDMARTVAVGIVTDVTPR